MRERDVKVKRDMDHDHEKPEVPEHFSCIDPKQQAMVLQALTNFDKELTGQALVHLKLCLYCQEIAETINRTYCSPARSKTYRAAGPKSTYDNCTNVVIATKLMTKVDVWSRSN